MPSVRGVSCGGNIPEPRMGHSAAPLGSEKLLVFAGKGYLQTVTDSAGADPEKAFNNCFVLDLHSFEWREVPTNKTPPAWYDYTTRFIASKNSILIFGGSGPSEIFSDIHILSLGNYVPSLI